MEELEQLIEQVLKAAPEFIKIGILSDVAFWIFLLALLSKIADFWFERRHREEMADILMKRLLTASEQALTRGLLGRTALVDIWYTLITFFSAVLLSKITEKILKFPSSSGRKQNSVNITVVGILIGRKAKQLSGAYAILTLAMTSYILFSFWANRETNAAVLFVISAFFLVVFINEKSLGYRIKHGLYGSNEYEAREILTFILNHADKTDFTSGSGLRNIIPAPEADHVYGTEPVPGVEGVTA